MPLRFSRRAIFNAGHNLSKKVIPSATKARMPPCAGTDRCADRKLPQSCRESAYRIFGFFNRTPIPASRSASKNRIPAFSNACWIRNNVATFPAGPSNSSIRCTVATPISAAFARSPCRGNRSGLRGQVHAAVVILRRGRGREAHGPGSAQHVGHQCQGGGALGHYRRRQMGRDHHSGRLALSAPPSDGGEKVLAACGERRAASTVRRRAVAAAHGGRPGGRHELLQQLGGICRCLPPDP